MKTLDGLISQTPEDSFFSILRVAVSLGLAAGTEGLENLFQFVIGDTSHLHKKITGGLPPVFVEQMI